MLVAAVAVTSAGAREIAIEFLLLLGRQQCANLIVGLKDELLMLALKILVKLIHLHTRIAHQGFDLMQLVGG